MKWEKQNWIYLHTLFEEYLPLITKKWKHSLVWFGSIKPFIVVHDNSSFKDNGCGDRLKCHWGCSVLLNNGPCLWICRSEQSWADADTPADNVSVIKSNKYRDAHWLHVVGSGMLARGPQNFFYRHFQNLHRMSPPLYGSIKLTLAQNSDPELKSPWTARLLIKRHSPSCERHIYLPNKRSKQINQ